MAEYEIVKTERYHAGSGSWLTICEVEIHLPECDLYSADEIAEMKQNGEEAADCWMTNWIVVGCGYLNVYDIEPFGDDQEEQPEPIESFELDDYDPVYVMETHPGLDLYDYCDDYWFYLDTPGTNYIVVHPYNLLFNVCCWADKFLQHRKGYC